MLYKDLVCTSITAMYYYSTETVATRCTHEHVASYDLKRVQSLNLYRGTSAFSLPPTHYTESRTYARLGKQMDEVALQSKGCQMYSVQMKLVSRVIRPVSISALLVRSGRL